MNKVVAMVVGLVIAMTGCSSPTPGLCCTDQADCAAAGLSVGSTCDEGLACRGHQCVAEVCSKSADCDATAPYCKSDGASGLCTASCSEDAQCPGSSQDASQTYCDKGACVGCRTDDDCALGAPICDGGTCRGCQAHSECGTHVCATNGTCADESDIAHVAVTGDSSANCSKLSPCTLVRAVSAASTRYILLAPGAYTSTDTLVVSGLRTMIGDGSPRPTITHTAPGAVISVDALSDITIDNLHVTGATSNSAEITVRQSAVLCDGFSANDGARTLRVIDSDISNNDASGLGGEFCVIYAARSSFRENRSGVWSSDSDSTYDRCIFENNTVQGIYSDGGLINLTNSLIVRNMTGVDAQPSRLGSTAAFNTIADNVSIGVNCGPYNGATMTAPNNIVARNGNNGGPSASCTFPGSIITNDISQLHFVQPDTAPYDYHLGAGSVAIDAAVASTVDHDFDGDARPKGKGRDVGADEAQ